MPARRPNGQKRLRVEDEGGSQPQPELAASSGQQNSLQQLESALASIKTEWEVERNSLQAKVAKLETEVGKERATAARCQQEMEALHEESEALREQLGEAKEAAQRREEEGNRFHYVLAGNGQGGSIPRSHLESAPNSLLCKMYNGDWEYARDEQGRALIICHPDRWAAILEHLATGAVPAERNPQLLEQARHWNLKRLVNALEAMTPGVVVTSPPETKEFTVRCNFVSVRKAVQTDGDIKMYFAEPHNEGRLWGVKVDEKRVSLFPAERSELVITCHLHVLLREKVLKMNEGGTDTFKYSKDFEGWGYDFGDTMGYSLDQLLSEPLARADDCFVVELKLTM